MIIPENKELLVQKGIPGVQIAEQLTCFQKGFPYLRLDAATSAEKDILAPDAKERKTCLTVQGAYTSSDKTAVKLVLASGATSRMFKGLLEFLDIDHAEPTTESGQTFFASTEEFALYDDLNTTCMEIGGKNTPNLITDDDYKAIVPGLLSIAGLNYGAFPKGLPKLHKYEEGPHTPLEEYSTEDTTYAASKDGKVSVHSTISTEHCGLFKSLVTEKAGAFAKRYGVDYSVSFSEQEPSTDTIVADMESRPSRDSGKFLFRPGGHEALTEDPNDLGTDAIFVRNIDNVAPDRSRDDTALYRELIAGVLVSLQKQAFEYLGPLDSGRYIYEQVMDILQFVQKKLFYESPETRDLEDTELVIYLKGKLDRPMRVCDIVKSAGEPGGDPFLAYSSNGTISLQILGNS